MSGYRPRVIALSKKQGQSFGFFLRVEHGEEGHLIRNLEMGGPAELAGLRDGDRILRVNGNYVDGMEHPLVVNLVRGSSTSVSFHVLDEASYKQAKIEGVDLSDPHPRPTQSQSIMNGVSGPEPKPKLCYLVKASGSYGFSLRSVSGEQGVFMTEVSPGGVAEKAGVKTNDRLVEVNGENVECSTHDQIVGMIKAVGSSIMFLLVDEDTDRFYKNKRMGLGAGLATLKHLPQKPRIVDLTKGSDGYGYFLRAEPNKKGHFIKDIDRGSPADKAGLKEMDRLVAVDGEKVNTCTHEQVVDRIRQSGNKCCLLVVDAETDNMYKMGGVSPMLFWEEMRGSVLPPSYPAATAVPTPVPVATPKPAAPVEAELKPKLCKMEKTPTGYGFHLNGIQGVSGQYIKEVVRGGAADRAGVEDNDILVEVDGVNVENSTHEEVVELIRKSGSSLVLLVAEKRVYDQLKAKGVAITALLLAPPSPARSHTPTTLEEVREEKEREELEEKKEEEREKREEEEEKKKEEEREKREEEEEKRKEEEKKKEEKREEEEKEKKEEAARPDTPPAQTRERAPSSSSSSSEDERF